MRRQSLKTRFLQKISITLLVVFAVNMAIFYGLFRSEFRLAIQEKGEALSFAVRDRAQSNLQMTGGDHSALRGLSVELQRLISGQNQVEYARLVNQNGVILASNQALEVNDRISLEKPPAGETSTVVSRGNHLEVFASIPNTDGLLVQIGFESSAFNQKVFRTTFILIFIALGSLLLLALFVNYWIRESVEAPLDELVRDADRVAEGDLSVAFATEQERSDEIGRLIGAFSRMTEGLRGIVQRINHITGSLSDETVQLRSQNEELTAAVHGQNASLQDSIQSIEHIDRNTGEINERVEELFLVSQESSSSILQMGGSIEEVKEHVAQLSGAVAETSSSIIEITRSISEVASRSQDLAGGADDMNEAIQQITQTITNVEQNAQQSTDLANQVSKSAREGLESVEKSGDSMNRIKVSVQETAEVIQQLGNRSQEIGEIITVINQVTEKTNLLALNAAIIAAAAGEHGASFGVVADGIRDLARQVAAKTREIEQLVQGVQKETHKAVEKVTSGLSTVHEGEELSRAARDKLGQIYDLSLRSEDMSHHISDAMAEQNRSSQSLAEASQRVSTISHQIAVATQQEASASNQIQRSVTQMEELANSVLRATREQSEGSKRISEAIHRITTSVTAINDLATDHKSESESVLRSIQANQSLLQANDDLLHSLQDHVVRVNTAVTDLQQAIDRFQT